MIIWINGAFGAGKTQTAYELHRRIPRSFVYDPENIGYFFYNNIPPEMKNGDFQDYERWRKYNLDMLRWICESYDGTVIVPMTLTSPEYYAELVGGLEALGIDVRHYILLPDRKTIEKRLRGRLETKNDWAFRQIERCAGTFESGIIPGRRLKNDRMTVAQTAEAIARDCGISIEDDRRSAPARWLSRKAVQLRHIR